MASFPSDMSSGLPFRAFGNVAVFVSGCVFLALAVIAWKLLAALRSRLWLSYGNLPTAPGLSLTEDHSTIPSSRPRGVVQGEWFAVKGKTLIIRVPPYWRPVILSADPSCAAYLQKNTTDFEVSARMGQTMGGLGLHSCITCVVGDPRRRVKRSLETAFSASAMRHYFPAILGKSIQGRDKLLESAKARGEGQTVAINARAEITRIMVDVVSKCYLGSDFDAIRTGTPTEMEVRLKKFYVARQHIHWWHYYTLTGRKKVRDVARALQDIVVYAASICEEKKASLRDKLWDSDGKTDDILTSICRNNLDTDVKSSQHLTDAELSHNVLPIVVGSTDVLAMGIMFTLHCLATHPEVQKKLRRALAELSDSPTLDELNRVTYFDNVIEEAMRLYQPYDNIERTATQDCVIPLRYPVIGRDGKPIDSIVVMKGTEVRIALKCLNSDPELYGPDVESFRPERFTDGSCSAYTEQMGFQSGRSTIFWGGGRGCPVFNYALASLKSIVFTMVRSFEISEPDDQRVVFGGGGVARGSAVWINGQIIGDIPMILKPIQLNKSKD